MKILITTILVFLTFIASAQDSIQIKTYYSSTTNSKLRESYWVLKVDSTTKVGSYNAYFESGKNWIFGFYNNGEKVGIWVFYDLHTWEPFLKYDYDKNEEKYYHNKYVEEGPEYFAKIDDKIIKLDRMSYCPDFLPDSYEGFNNYIANQISTSKILDLIDQNCNIYVQITFSDSGNVTGEILRNNCNELVGNEIVKIVNASPRWIPGEYNGNRVSNRITLPVNLKKHTP